MLHPQKIAVKLGRSFDGAGMDAVSLLGLGAMDFCGVVPVCARAAPWDRARAARCPPQDGSETKVCCSILCYSLRGYFALVV